MGMFSGHPSGRRSNETEDARFDRLAEEGRRQMVVCKTAKDIVKLAAQLPEIGQHALDNFANQLAISDVGDVYGITKNFLRHWLNDSEPKTRTICNNILYAATKCG